MIPCIDHNLLSPSGHISKRTKKAAMARFHKELFPDGFPQPQCQQPTAKESLLREAATLRELAARGMKPRAYLKRAIELENQAGSIQ